MALKDVRAPLLKEALHSPTLLADVAALENYVAESYAARALIEMLQNADDAGAKRLLVSYDDGRLVVANDGRLFSDDDLLALCRSGASQKRRGESIGYRGIGFKAVVGLCSEVLLISGPLRARFSRELTRLEIPNANAVPLIRIPHSADDVRTDDSLLGSLLANGYRTIFVLSGVSRGNLELDLSEFDPTSALFLRHIECIDRTGLHRDSIHVTRTQSTTTVSQGEKKTSWSIERHGDLELAFRQDGDGKRQALDQSSAVVHAFLPTHELTGFAFKVNGDFSTDPSRTRVVFDERSDGIIAQFADVYVRMVCAAVASGDASGVEVLAPTDDPRLTALQRESFRSRLYARIVELGRGTLSDYTLPPSYISAEEFCRLAEVSRAKAPALAICQSAVCVGLMKVFGAKEAPLQKVASGTATYEQLSTDGAAGVISEIAKQLMTRQIDASAIDDSWRLWSAGGRKRSLADLRAHPEPLDSDFVDLATERLGGPIMFRSLVKEVYGEDAATLIGRCNEDASEDTAPRAPQLVKGLSLTRWRGAEQIVTQILTAQGFIVEDVSRQNIGYDLRAVKAAASVCIEVKHVEAMGKPFILTMNEETVAREKRNQYAIAIIAQGDEGVSFGLVRDPVQTLKMDRQCRQWVWECSSYDIDAEFYTYSNEGK